ncbi:MAG: class I adenylate-forming enzyme family protein [Hyphomicrobiales bacterium]
MLLSLFNNQANLIDQRLDETIDLSKFKKNIKARADVLHRSGLGNGQCAIVARTAPLDYLLDIFALWQVGAMAVAINPSITQEERDNVMRATNASHLLDDTPLVAIKGGACHAYEPLGMNESALTLMTSGTTGQPKGIVHTQQSLAARIALNIAAIGADTLARSLCVLPLHFGHGLIGNIFTVMAAGGTLHLWPQPSIQEMASFGPLIDEHRFTFMSSTPSYWKIAMRLSPRPHHAMQRVHVGSAPLSIENWQAIAEWTGTQKVFNMYGMTETANWIGGACLEDENLADGLVGQPWGGSLALLDQNNKVTREGTGEVLISTPSIMTGYLGMEEATQAAFHDSWFRTGDIGRLDAEGCLTLIGRIKHEINRGGVKIPAEEIDLLLERHPAINEACAFSIEDPIAGEAVAAAIVFNEEANVQSILEWCRERCRAEAVPSKLFLLDEIPRNDRGKVVRDRVREAALAIGAGE